MLDAGASSLVLFVIGPGEIPAISRCKLATALASASAAALDVAASEAEGGQSGSCAIMFVLRIASCTTVLTELGRSRLFILRLSLATVFQKSKIIDNDFFGPSWCSYHILKNPPSSHMSSIDHPSFKSRPSFPPEFQNKLRRHIWADLQRMIDE